MNESQIQWTDKTWNPVRGCSLVSAGCKNCYAMKQAHRFSGPGGKYEGLTELGPNGPRWNGKIRLVPEALEQPLRLRKPSRIFVNSMSDLFHESVSDEFIARVFSVMAEADRHTFQVLTKRPERMAATVRTIKRVVAEDWERFDGGRFTWPLPNIWLGVSVEDQKTADQRIPLLLQTPAAVRFVSYEPALGPVHFGGALYRRLGCEGAQPDPECLECRDACGKLDWIIVGGESGPKARPFELAWARQTVSQCKAAGVPVFVKQIGSHPFSERQEPGWATLYKDRHGQEPSGHFAPHFLNDSHGGNWDEWPEDLRVRQFPEAQP